MARIVVQIPGERAYDVVVSAGQIDRLGAEMRAFDTNQKALIITDTEVAVREALPLVAGAGTKPRRAAGQAHRRARGPGAGAGADRREPLG